ncbi:CRTAC1 family protein [Paludisphaera mucosa]|uniref:CRTAC1 family protein n=1 Tax=Paludisphaera mucosa TaxID=3030827 RepID=A0ABT6F8W6_9BACT|nr:CRTAC1 family protein [Paludisphaera mucosa]MDG3003989.1 CRTAC1 family protein [Paludisphaera mucosa]
MRGTTRSGPGTRVAGLSRGLAGAAFAALLALAGCGGGGGGPDPEARPAGKVAAASGRPGPTSKPSTPRPTAKKPAQAVSSIPGDRVTLVTSSVVLSKQTESSPFRFAEVSKEWGVDFVHFSGMVDEKHFPTANGSGVAIFDYDGDGRLDLYFATQTLLPLGTAEKGSNRLFRNLGDGRFEDATERSGLGFRGFCHGVVVGDVDNDGDRDVFLCNYGPNRLYRNNGDGTFLDVSAKAGVDRPSWSSGGAMLDYDNDGDLDVYVANYGRWNYPEDHARVGDAEKKIWLYASPRSIVPVKHMLYRNNGDLTFTDVFDQAITVETEVVTGQKEEVDPKTGAKKKVDVVEKKREPHPRADGHGFGVVAADLNDDGLVDLYVANDMNPNFLFFNRGDGTFDDATELSGAAFDYNGVAQSGMGVDAEDVDGDGFPELFVTNFAQEYATLYQNFGNRGFFDNTAFFGLASDTMPFVKWGTGLVDFDADGWPDVFISNGHVDDNRRKLGQPIDYEEPAQLFRNMDGKRFRLSTRDVGPYFEQKHVGRGAAFGDIDDDGDVDIVVNEKDRPAAILRNDTPTKNHWIRLALQGTKSNRDAVGSLAIVETPKRTIYRQLKGGVSMESANDPRLTIGVGADPIDRLTIVWPSGIVTTLEKPDLDREHRLVEPADQAPTMLYGQPRVKREPAKDPAAK